MITYIRVLTLIKLNLIRNGAGFYCWNNKKSVDILNIAIKYGVIAGFKLINTKRLYVITSNKLTCPKISIISTASNKKIIKLNSIKKLTNKKTCSQYIILTSKGVCTLDTAVNKITGGIVLAKIN